MTAEYEGAGRASPLDRIRAALEEARWPDADVRLDESGMVVCDLSTVPDAVWWAAYEVAFRGRCESEHCEGVCSDGTSACIGLHPCWPCWNDCLGDLCGAGKCQHPDQDRWPDRHLLTGWVHIVVGDGR